MVQQVIVAIDTNVFISVINRERGYSESKKILDWIDEGRIRGLVSTIVLAEVISGYTRELTNERDDFLAQILGSASYQVVDVTVPLALDAGSLQARTGMKMRDALILASALRKGGEFLISNDGAIGKAKVEGVDIVTPSEFVKLFPQLETMAEEY